MLAVAIGTCCFIPEAFHLPELPYLEGVLRDKQPGLMANNEVNDPISFTGLCQVADTIGVNDGAKRMTIVPAGTIAVAKVVVCAFLFHKLNYFQKKKEKKRKLLPQRQPRARPKGNGIKSVPKAVGAVAT